MWKSPLSKTPHNIKARGLKAYILRRLDRKEEAKAWAEENLALDPFDFLSGNEKVILHNNDRRMREELNARMRFFRENYLMTARDYGEAGAYGEAAALLGECTEEYPMLCYYRAYYAAVWEKMRTLC